MTTTAQTDEAAAAQHEIDDDELIGDVIEEPEDALEAPRVPAPVAAAHVGPSLSDALARERDNLRSQRESLIEELRRIEIEIEVVDERTSHVDALLQPIMAIAE